MPLVGINEELLEETTIYEWLGSTVGMLHNVTNIKTLKLPKYDPLRWTNQRIRKLTDLRYPQSRQLQCEAHRIKRTLDIFMADLPRVLLHGDIHLDNIAVNTDTGDYVLTDYESACIGPAIGDLYPSAGWIKRTGMPTKTQMDAYRQAYIGQSFTDPWETNEEVFHVLDTIRSLSQLTWRLLNERVT